MCKIMIIPKVKNNKTALKLLKATAPYMTQNDQDGIGYAALLASGELTGERWLDTKAAFKPPMASMGSVESDNLAPLAECLEDYVVEGYTSFGPGFKGGSIKSIIYHSRYATSAKGVKNLHPFVLNQSALIHNGVISNTDAFPPVQSTCDSESLLNAYTEYDVANAPLQLQTLSDNIQGWYAAGVLALRDDGQWILDVFKDSTDLYCIYVNELESHVYCTDADIVKAGCELLKWTTGLAYRVKNNTLIRYDAMTGSVLDTWDYERSIKTKYRYTSEQSSFTDYENALARDYSSIDDPTDPLSKYWKYERDERDELAAEALEDFEDDIEDVPESELVQKTLRYLKRGAL